MNIDPAIPLGRRPRMISVAYRMPGRVSDAEDAVRGAFVRLQAAAEVSSPGGALIRATTRLWIDRLRAARDCEMHATTVNGEPGVGFTSGGAVIHVVSLRIEGGGRAVSMTLNPDKLSLWSVAEID